MEKAYKCYKLLCGQTRPVTKLRWAQGARRTTPSLRDNQLLLLQEATAWTEHTCSGSPEMTSQRKAEIQISWSINIRNSIFWKPQIWISEVTPWSSLESGANEERTPSGLEGTFCILFWAGYMCGGNLWPFHGAIHLLSVRFFSDKKVKKRNTYVICLCCIKHPSSPNMKAWWR